MVNLRMIETVNYILVMNDDVAVFLPVISQIPYLRLISFTNRREKRPSETRGGTRKR